MAATPIDIYRRQIERELQAGNATEHTHRPALKDLIESLEAGVTRQGRVAPLVRERFVRAVAPVSRFKRRGGEFTGGWASKALKRFLGPSSRTQEGKPTT